MRFLNIEQTSPHNFSLQPLYQRSPHLSVQINTL
jgi:hypothetical protein